MFSSIIFTFKEQKFILFQNKDLKYEKIVPLIPRYCAAMKMSNILSLRNSW